MAPRVTAGIVALTAALAPRPAVAQFLFDPGAQVFDTAVVSVIGRGQAFAPPSRAVVFVQIVTREDSPEIASLRNGELRLAVAETLSELGFGPGAVSLWDYGSAPSPDRGFVGPPTAAAAAPHDVKSGLRVVVEPVDRLESVASALAMAGATVSTVFLESDVSEPAHRAAARDAVRQARIEAEAMAEAAGGRLGELLRLTAVPDFGAAASGWSVYPGGPGSDGVHLTPEDLVVEVTVMATWIFVEE